MLHNLTIGLAVVLSFAASRANAGNITGTADKIVDDDTLWICDQSACHKIRLCGIDTPELHDSGGEDARAVLEALVEGKVVACTPVGEGTVCDGRSARTSYDRIVAQCFASENDVTDGWQSRKQLIGAAESVGSALSSPISGSGAHRHSCPSDAS